MKKYIAPSMRVKKLKTFCILAGSGVDEVEDPDHEGGAKQTNLSFDDEFDSENEW